MNLMPIIPTLSVIFFILSMWIISNKKLSFIKYILLIILPPLLVSIFLSILAMFTKTQFNDVIFTLILLTRYLGFFMLPFLLIYSIATLLYEERDKPKALKLSIATAIIGAISATPYILFYFRDIPDIYILLIPFITAFFSSLIIYKITKRRQYENLN